jgi:hypothetical protein
VEAYGEWTRERVEEASQVVSLQLSYALVVPLVHSESDQLPASCGAYTDQLQVYTLHASDESRCKRRVVQV